MDSYLAAKNLSALAQQSRLEVFRLLVRCGIEGMPAGEIARALGVPHNTLSSQLSVLQNAGLVRSRRKSRSIIYRVDFEGTRNLLAYLLEDCCQGRAEVCQPFFNDLLANCCDTIN